MKLLIRYVKEQGQGEVTEQVVLDSSVLSIGRGTNQDILLADPKVALAHAKIFIQESGGKVVAAAGKYVIKDSQAVKKCSLKLGEEIEISGHKISLLPAQSNYDFVVLVSVNLIEQTPLQQRYELSFSDLTLSKRSWSWTLFLSILLLGLLLPIYGVINPLWMEALRQSPLPDDSQWLAGDLIKAHKFIGNDCAMCHTTAFIPTTNQACQSCHNTIKPHINDIELSTSVNEVRQCTSCHKEHNPQQTLSRYSQQLCVDCHREPIKNRSNNSVFASATDFEHAHPAFKVSVLTALSKDKKIIDWQAKRLALKDSQLTEQSNLKFSHQLHLDPQGIKSTTGEIKLVCSDCHVSEVNGGAMQPITMEKNCQSCHQLTFDVDDPTRVVPHGSPADVLMMMREYYAFRYIYQNLNQDPDDNVRVKAGDLFTIRPARRPGREQKLRKDFQYSLNEQTIASIKNLTKQTIRTDALVWAESRAYVAASDIFERQSCEVCHVVTKNDDTELPWQVQPVRLTKQWLPFANFTHNAHQSRECKSCHKAASSKVSSDILMPNIDNCQQCHGGEKSHNLIPNTCIDCHDFHNTNTHALVGYNLSHNSSYKKVTPFSKVIIKAKNYEE